MIFGIIQKMEYESTRTTELFGKWSGQKYDTTFELEIGSNQICSLLLHKSDVVNIAKKPLSGRCKLISKKFPAVLKINQIEGIQGPIYFSVIPVDKTSIRISSIAKRWRHIDVNPLDVFGLTLRRVR